MWLVTVAHRAVIFYIDHLHAIRKRVAGKRDGVKRDSRNLCQHDLLHESAVLANEQPGGLGHAFQDERVRHDRRAGEVIVQMIFRERNRFDRRRSAAAFELRESIDPKPAHGNPKLNFANGKRAARLGQLALHVVD